METLLVSAVLSSTCPCPPTCSVSAQLLELKVRNHFGITEVIAHSQYQKSKRISIFLSMQDEVETEEIIRDIFRQGKTCFVPRYRFQNNHMDMLRLTSPDEISLLPRTSWNILQPGEDEVREEALSTGSLRSRTTGDPAEMTVLEVSNVRPISPDHCVQNPESLGVVPKGNLQRTRLLTDTGSALFGMCSDARKHDVHSVLSQMHRRIRDRSPEWGGRVD
ncbi:5-formyltetrahydrofolate cyclo-ligase isoform X2 [Lynx rufus]|uniref:5-formyltetrahydrofolate cyclo-ligase isoform X2 n=1 Tax=Lynx rufus TaxID=61384 RepID=UPI001F1250B1|nr:5-formyltetrahydrofolate cyclo-ligase isoform X2 [Lynx rufus]